MAKDYSFTEPFERRTCPSCNYVSEAPWVVSSKVACPQCGHEVNCAPKLGHLKQRTIKLLNLGTAEDAQRTWPILIPYTGTVEEHIAMPILTITFLEAMLDHLLETMGSTKVTDEAAMAVVADRVDHLSSFEARTDYFRELTEISLESAMKAAQFPKFYIDLTNVRHSRNAFVHGDPYALTAAVAETALQLAKDAVPLFAELRNKYGIRSNIRSAP